MNGTKTVEVKSARDGFYRVLSDTEIVQIHEASIKILSEVGFEVSFTPLLELLEEKGAQVDWDQKRVFLPPKLISLSVKQAPEQFVYYGLENGKEIYLGKDRIYFGTGGKALYVMEGDGKRRPALLEDIVRFARLSDMLDFVDFFIIPVHSHDVNVNYLDINDFYHALKNTGKPVMGGIFSVEGLHRVVEMCSLLAGSTEKLRQRPFVGFITAITSPLKIENDSAEILMETARYGLPLVVSTAPIAGVSAPVTLAGTLAVQNAESLLGVILSQLVNPGTPVFYSAVPCTMDMRSGTFLMGSIESGLMNAAVAQMARFYHLPSYVTVGVTDSKVPDAQAAIESATSCLLGALAGGSFLHQMFGFLDGALTISYAQFLIDNDIVGSCCRALQGIELTPQCIAAEAIADVGCGGSYLMHRHTIEHMRGEMFAPQLKLLGHGYRKWLNADARDTRQKAEEIARSLLEQPSRNYIEAHLDSKILSSFRGLVEPVCK